MLKINNSNLFFKMDLNKLAEEYKLPPIKSLPKEPLQRGGVIGLKRRDYTIPILIGIGVVFFILYTRNR